MSSQRTIKLLATAILEGAQGILETEALLALGVRRIKEVFWEETRHRARKWHLWPRALGTEEEGAQEASLSRYYVPGTGLGPGGCSSDGTTKIPALLALTSSSVGKRVAGKSSWRGAGSWVVVTGGQRRLSLSYSRWIW